MTRVETDCDGTQFADIRVNGLEVVNVDVRPEEGVYKIRVLEPGNVAEPEFVIERELPEE